jgi:hypothetical protein
MCQFRHRALVRAYVARLLPEWQNALQLLIFTGVNGSKEARITYKKIGFRERHQNCMQLVQVQPSLIANGFRKVEIGGDDGHAGTNWGREGERKN